MLAILITAVKHSHSNQRNCLGPSGRHCRAGEVTYAEISVSRSFMDEYMQALFLPHTDLNAFPTVKHQMRKAKTWHPPAVHFS